MTEESTTTASGSTRSVKLLHGVILLAVLVIVGTSIAYGDRLPDPLTTRWGPDGQPSGTLPHQGLIMISGFITLGVGSGLLFMARQLRDERVARGAAAAALALAAGLAGLHWATLEANLGAAPAALSGRDLVLTGVASAIAAAIGWRFGPDGKPGGPESLDIQALEIQPGEAVIWSGSQNAPPVFWALPGVMTVLGLVLLITDEPSAGAIVVGTSVLVVSMLRVRVSVGPAGMAIRIGPMGLLTKRVGLDQIADVTAERVDPMQHGGWGLRMTPGTRAVVLRCGPGIRVSRSDAADLVVTLDDAQVAAGVLKAHLDSRGAAV